MKDLWGSLVSRESPAVAAVQECPYDLEALALFANKRIGRYPVIVEKDLICINRPPTHFFDFPKVQTRCGFVKVNAEQGQPL